MRTVAAVGGVRTLIRPCGTPSARKGAMAAKEKDQQRRFSASPIAIGVGVRVNRVHAFGSLPGARRAKDWDNPAAPRRTFNQYRPIKE